MHALSPETVIKAYALGVFPMAESRDDDNLFFIDPEIRGVLPLVGAHVPRRLKRTIRQQRYRVTVNQAFDAVIDGCRATTGSRDETWINPQIRQLYCALHRLGFAHSVEAWSLNEKGQTQLDGGLYGVALAGAFFGESMFTRGRDASKVALVHLMARLRSGGFTLLDAQFSNPHLKQFGVREVPRDEFRVLLQEALAAEARFPLDDDDSEMLQSFLQDNTETS